MKQLLKIIPIFYVIALLQLVFPCFANQQSMIQAVVSGVQEGGGGCADGAVGTSTGSNDAVTYRDAGHIIYNNYTASSSGTVDQVCFAGVNSSSGFTFNGAIYNSDGSTLLADGTLIAGNEAGHTCITLDSVVTITASTAYRLAIGSPNDTYWSITTVYDFGGLTARLVTGQTITDTMPSTVTGGTEESVEQALIYASCSTD